MSMKPARTLLFLCSRSCRHPPRSYCGAGGEPDIAEFIFESAPFASAHASTIVETREGLVAAWFGGTAKARTTSASGCRGASAESGRLRSKWRRACSRRHAIPTWNPVLFELRKGELALFYKVGPNPRAWWGMVRTSTDEGRTWGDARRLPDGILGPVKNKPVRLADGTIIAPSSTETPETPSTWRVHFERSRDGGATWSVSRPPRARRGSPIDAIQPSILMHADGRLQAVGRTRSGRVFETWSADRGQTWTPVTLTTAESQRRHRRCDTEGRPPSARLQPHAQGPNAAERCRPRDGRTWEAATCSKASRRVFVSAVIQTADGLVHITYTWRRERIKHVVIDPAKLRSQGCHGGAGETLQVYDTPT